MNPPPLSSSFLGNGFNTRTAAGLNSNFKTVKKGDLKTLHYLPQDVMAGHLEEKKTPSNVLVL